MPSGRFQPLSQGNNDDYNLQALSQDPQPLHYTHTISDPVDSTSKPARWYSKRSHVTYVSTPTDDAFEKPGRRATNKTRRSSRLSFLVNPVSNFRIPTFAAPWQHENPISTLSGQPSSTVRVFNRRKQWRRLFVNGLLQWLLTVTIVLAEFGALYGYSRPHVLSKLEKYSFNAIMTLLSLSLGLALVTALRSYAKLLSWRFLASGYRDLQDFELIMNCDSQSKVLKLLWAGRTPGRFGINKTQLLCGLSLLLVIGLQLTIGLLGLTYSMDSTWSWFTWDWGTVSYADLSNIYQDSSYNTTGVADQTGAANYYGLVGQNYYVEDTQPFGQGSDGQEAIYTTDYKTFWYNFVAQAPYDPTSPITPVVSTERYVTTNATCVQLEITSGGYINESDSLSALYFKDIDGIERGIWIEGNTVLTSTYISNSSATSTCGDRCTGLYILDTGYQPAANTTDSEDQAIAPQFFACNSTVSKVFNTDICSYEPNCTLSDENARYLAGAIGFDGTTYTENPLQYKTYPPGSPYSWDGYANEFYSNATWRAQQVAIFTADAVAAMDDAGPRIDMIGWFPKPGVALDVNWKYAIPVLCVVPVVQLFVLFLVCIFANGALIKDGGYLSTARLLRPVVEKLESHGCALTSDECARELGNFKIVYGVRSPAGRSGATDYRGGQDVDWHVGVIAESEGYGDAAAEGWKINATFPEGRYDGIGGSREEKQHLLSEDESM